MLKIWRYGVTLKRDIIEFFLNEKPSKPIHEYQQNQFSMFMTSLNRRLRPVKRWRDSNFAFWKLKYENKYLYLLSVLLEENKDKNYFLLKPSPDWYSSWVSRFNRQSFFHSNNLIIVMPQYANMFKGLHHSISKQME